jgi:hypothetical protein
MTMTDAPTPTETSKLAGLALDYWVAIGDGQRAEKFSHEGRGWVRLVGVGVPYSPSTLWAQGGPIIEREQMNVWHRDDEEADMQWHACVSLPSGYEVTEDGPTLLIAAMRAFVAAKLGASVG